MKIVKNLDPNMPYFLTGPPFYLQKVGSTLIKECTCLCSTFAFIQELFPESSFGLHVQRVCIFACSKSPR